jgi:hypothetical protein
MLLCDSRASFGQSRRESCTPQAFSDARRISNPLHQLNTACAEETPLPLLPIESGTACAKIVREHNDCRGGEFRVLYALLAGGGLGLGEATAPQVPDFSGSAVRVRHSNWNGKLYSPKTEAGAREVDLHPSLASLIREHIGIRTSGFIFQTLNGTPLHRSSVLRRAAQDSAEDGHG